MRLFSIAVILIISNLLQAQKPQKLDSGEIYNKLLRLQKVGTVMYLAAHPDDENTRLITWLSNHEHIETVYLSLTRGDGGQNLIGTETGDLLGILRTQELLQARRIDGGKQWFSRANDFGFSKKASETMRIWNKDEVLSDVVRAIRYWQPDIIINRFPADTTISTHGHHTSSAILSLEAFDLSSDPNKYPGSASKYGTWQPSRIYFNTSYFFYKSQAEFEKADKTSLATLDIGNYYPLLGKSNNEISAESRSMHRCQAFGSIGSRDQQKEYLMFLKGLTTTKKDNIFEGIDLTWTRIKGAKGINRMLRDIINKYDYSYPDKSVPALLELYNTIIEKLEITPRIQRKLDELKDIIASCLGLFMETVSSEAFSTRGAKVKVKIEVTNRSILPVEVRNLKIEPTIWDSSFIFECVPEKANFFETTITIPQDFQFTGPYWVSTPPAYGMYNVNEDSLIGMPETPRKLQTIYTLNINGTDLVYAKPIIHKYEDAVKGEIYTPFDIVPDVYITPLSEVVLFPENANKNIQVKLTASRDNVKGNLSINTAQGWSVSNNSQEFELSKKGDEKTITFSIQPPTTNSRNEVYFVATIGSQSFDKQLIEIAYEHIPTQRVIKPAKTNWVKEEIYSAAKEVAYIQGAGDKVPEALRELGINVTILKPQEINLNKLLSYDALLIGIRAYNTVNALANKKADLLAYMEKGGTVVTQYNTNYDLVTSDIGPYPFSISRGRVTDENAPMIISDPNHPIFQFPNKIESRDFENWVQERGLYFLTTEDTHYKKLLTSHDPGESPLDGSLLYSPYGSGHYIYCSLSFFRQLPAGVPGAYKLLANMLSIGKKITKP